MAKKNQAEGRSGDQRWRWEPSEKGGKLTVECSAKRPKVAKFGFSVDFKRPFEVKSSTVNGDPVGLTTEGTVLYASANSSGECVVEVAWTSPLESLPAVSAWSPA